MLPVLELDQGLIHVDGSGIERALHPAHLADHRGDLRERAQHGILSLHDLDRFRQGDRIGGHRHEHQGAFVERRHELVAHAGGEVRIEPLLAARQAVRHPPRAAGAGRRRGEERELHRRQQEARAADQEQGEDEPPPGEQQGRPLAAERPVEGRLVQAPGDAHHRVVRFRPDLAPDQKGREHRDERHRQERRADYGESLGERQGMKEPALFAGQRKDGKEGEDDNDHGKEYRPADLLRGVADGIDQRAVSSFSLDLAETIFGDDDAGVDQHADRNRDPHERHDVRSDTEDAHEDESNEDGDR